MTQPYNIGVDTNQQQGHADGFGGAAQTLGIASNFQANGPNPQAYNTFEGNAANTQQTYDQRAQAAQGRTAPVINNPYQLASQGALSGNQGEYGAIIGQLNNDINNPEDSYAVNQFRQATDASIAAQQAQANSARGGAVAQAGAQRAAQQQGAQTLAVAANQSGQIAEEDRIRAINSAIGANAASGNLNLGEYQTEQQNARDQAALQEQTARGNDTYALGLGQLGVQSQGQQLQAINGYNGYAQQAQDTNAQTANNAGQVGGKLFGTLLNTLGVGGANGTTAAGATGPAAPGAPNGYPPPTATG